MENNLNSLPLTQRKNKHILQRFSKVVGVISLIAAFITAGYLLSIMDGDDKVLQSFFGAISFFCFMMGLVLYTIGSTNLPDLTVPSDQEIKEQIRITENSKKP